MFIRSFQHADLASCATIYELAWNETFPDVSLSVTTDRLKGEIRGERIFVADKDGDVVGFASVWMAESFLHHLHVHPRYYRKGIGTALLRRVLQLTKFDLCLKCLNNNQRALQFYRHHGFELTGERGKDNLGEWTWLKFERHYTSGRGRLLGHGS